MQTNLAFDHKIVMVGFSEAEVQLYEVKMFGENLMKNCTCMCLPIIHKSSSA